MGIPGKLSLDEPRIGLHPRDMDRIIGVKHRLRDPGNWLQVVEHNLGFDAHRFAGDRAPACAPEDCEESRLPD